MPGSQNLTNFCQIIGKVKTHVSVVARRESFFVKVVKRIGYFCSTLTSFYWKTCSSGDIKKDDGNSSQD